MFTDQDDYLGLELKQLNLGLFSSGLRESTYLSMHVRCAICTSRKSTRRNPTVFNVLL